MLDTFKFNISETFKKPLCYTKSTSSSLFYFLNFKNYHTHKKSHIMKTMQNNMNLVKMHIYLSKLPKKKTIKTWGTFFKSRLLLNVDMNYVLHLVQS